MRLQVNITGFQMPIYKTHAVRCVRPQINNTGFEMPICETHAFKCLRLQVNIIGYEMPVYTTHALKCVRLQVDNTNFEMPIYIYIYIYKYISLLVKARERVLSYSSPSWYHIATVVTFFLLLAQLTAVSGFIERQNTFDNKVHNIYYIFLGNKIKFTCFFTLNNHIINEK